MFCKYSNLLGEINKGIHSIRFFNIAIIDVILTIIVAYLINLKLKKFSYPTVLTSLFLLGIIMHRIFCVRTTIDKFLFP